MKRRTLLVGGLTAGGFGLCLALVFRPFEAGPMYRGLPSSYWKNAVRDYAAQRPPTLMGRLESHLGLRGKNGMPTVLEKDPAAIPVVVDLTKAMGEAFVVAPKTRRFKLGEVISQLLPRCPETWRQDTGLSVLIAYDYSQPSYFLARNDLVTLLGPPDSNSEDHMDYIIERSNGMLWYLSVDLHEGYVVRSTVYGIMDSK